MSGKLDAAGNLSVFQSSQTGGILKAIADKEASPNRPKKGNKVQFSRKILKLTATNQPDDAEDAIETKVTEETDELVDIVVEN